MLQILIFILCVYYIEIKIINNRLTDLYFLQPRATKLVFVYSNARLLVRHQRQEQRFWQCRVADADDEGSEDEEQVNSQASVEDARVETDLEDDLGDILDELEDF